MAESYLPFCWSYELREWWTPQAGAARSAGPALGTVGSVGDSLERHHGALRLLLWRGARGSVGELGRPTRSTGQRGTGEADSH